MMMQGQMSAETKVGVASDHDKLYGVYFRHSSYYHDMMNYPVKVDERSYIEFFPYYCWTDTSTRDRA